MAGFWGAVEGPWNARGRLGIACSGGRLVSEIFGDPWEITAGRLWVPAN